MASLPLNSAISLVPSRNIWEVREDAMQQCKSPERNYASVTVTSYVAFAPLRPSAKVKYKPSLSQSGRGNTN